MDPMDFIASGFAEVQQPQDTMRLKSLDCYAEMKSVDGGYKHSLLLFSSRSFPQLIDCLPSLLEVVARVSLYSTQP